MKQFVAFCNEEKICNPDWLKFSSGQNEPFFLYWMSRDYACFAPIQTQITIIQKIKKYINQINTREIKPEPEFNKQVQLFRRHSEWLTMEGQARARRGYPLRAEKTVQSFFP